MKVFISWSGETSRLVASTLRDWLPNVIQAVDPWMSSSDIDKGARWATEISNQLAYSEFSLICLTPENLTSPWILFEAGALSKSIENNFVCPYLFQVEPRNVGWPLAQFQLTKAGKDETLKLLHTMNIAQGNEESLPENRIDKAFEQWWPMLERDLAKISRSGNEVQSVRPDREILNEILELVRTASRETILDNQEVGEAKDHAPVGTELEVQLEASQRIKRKGVFIGAYVPTKLRELLRERAQQNDRGISQEIHGILADYIARTGG